MTPTYRIEMASRRYSYSHVAWNTRRDGRATDENLAAYMDAFVASCTTGVNAHLGDPRVFACRIVRQSDDKIVAAWSAPLFAVST